jgi:indole-3-acetate monooxygenase
MRDAAPSSYQETVRALAPQIEASVEENERTRRLAPSLVEAIARGGLFRLWRPRSLGGDEVDVMTTMRVVEAVSRIDGSTGWCLAIQGNGSLLSGYLTKAGAREIFGSDPDVVLAGALPPFGEAIVVEGGYRATGRWPFAIGCQHAQWLVGGCRIVDGVQPRLRPDGMPFVRVLCFPSASCEILDTWHTMGMRGTGSHDFAVRDVFVPAAHTVSLREAPVEPGPLYAFPTLALLGASLAAVELGIARHAIDILSEVAQTKIALRSRQVLSQQAMLQADLGRAEGLLRSGRALLYETLDELWHLVAAGQAPSIAQRAMQVVASTQATQSAIQTVELMFSAAGSAAVYTTTSQLERCLRDARTAGQHIAVVPANYEMIGQAILGFDMRMTPLLIMDDRNAG